MEMSKHAERMSQIRGITIEAISLHQRYADQDAFVGSGCSSSTVSAKGFEDMMKNGVPIQVAEKVRRMAIVYGSDDCIVTLFPMIKGKAQAYTRGSRKH